jgi:hypothetical protein
MRRVYVLVWLDNKGLNDFYAPYRDLHINDLQKGGFFTVLMGLWCVSMVLGVIVRVITRQRGAKPRTRYSPKGKGEKRMAAFKVYNSATGKMLGVSHISIAAGQSPVCKACKLGSICYASRQQKCHPSIKKSYWENGENLTAKVHPMKDIPYVNSLLCRFNAFGEIFTGAKGRNQLLNYVQTCIKNPGVTFVLWSRNYKFVEEFFENDCPRPCNLKLMRSTEDVDTPLYEVPKGWDGVFNVVTKGFAEKNNLTINCGIKDGYSEKIGCARCKVGCYTPGAKGVVAIEIRK